VVALKLLIAVALVCVLAAGFALAPRPGLVTDCPDCTCNTVCPDYELRCPACETCVQKDLELRYVCLDFEEKGGVVTISGVDHLANSYGSSMLPVSHNGQLHYYVDFSGDYRELSSGMVVLANHGGSRIAHAVKAVYPDYVVLYGVNNPAGQVERVSLEDVTHVEAKPCDAG